MPSWLPNTYVLLDHIIGPQTRIIPHTAVSPQCASSLLPAHLPRPRLRSAAVNQTADKAYYFFDGYAHFAAGLVSHGTRAACCSQGTGQQATSAHLPAAAAPRTLEPVLCTPAVRGPSH